MKSRHITFLLPGAARVPIGGYKVVYEYSNRLAKRGHRVTVVHPAFLTKGNGPVEAGRSIARYFAWKIAGFGPKSWFEINSDVELRWVPSLSARYIPDGDAVIATAWQTAEWAATYLESKGRKFYLIQDLETWHGMDDRTIATWHLPLRKLVIAQWLMDIAHRLGEEAFYLPNGLDLKQFFMTKTPEDRDSATVMMLYHTAMKKGSADGLKALSIVKEEVPSLQALLFGTSPAPPHLPPWIRYYRRPKQGVLRDLYNASAIFVAPSWSEGWGLPPSEAMMCGAALAVTSAGGHREYAIPEQTALLSPPRAPEQLAANILRLIRDPSLRSSIARNGHKYIQQFTWERSVLRLESILCDQTP